jgi:hypothetical protein
MFKEIHTDIPQNICDIIIEQAKENYKRKNRNDISVIVYKIKEN